MSHSSSGLQFDEIQGLIVSGYGDRPVASYALFEITDPARARAWIGRMLPSIQFSSYRSTPRYLPPFLDNICFNLAFTYEGFAALGLHETALSGFCLSFQGGLDDPHRARRLGDDGPSAPDNWAWGGPNNPPVHGLLAVFAGHGDAREGDRELPRKAIAAEVHEDNGLRLVKALHAHPTNRVLRKEHFGFRDGISNPRLASLALEPKGPNVIADGEIVLGYPNAYGRLPLSPEVPAEADPAGDLPLSQDDEAPSRRDFGRNGTYLVFSQIEQNVKAFWQYVFRAATDLPDAPPGRQGAIWLAAKMVGRWPNGTPISLFPDAPGDDEHRDANDFTFASRNDAFGELCPIGSHIRRTNPRDTGLPVPHDPRLSGSPTDDDEREKHIERANRHRIMRRGRPYGEPLDPLYDPEAMLAAAEKEEREAKEGNAPEARGLFFLGMNANISRQYEFIRANWVLNPTFAGLSRDPDPLLGAQRACPFPASHFTLQGYPPRQLRNVPRVVETRGGAYFFLPSRSALLHLSREH
ncbi:Dyp-type peroxidase [Pendulispora albinea]|uniref:Peroxidase n=1 Tax=Pendulispora albinea TaxID=2741071 RepID=A0ABZ2MBW3_9BACT